MQSYQAKRPIADFLLKRKEADFLQKHIKMAAFAESRQLVLGVLGKYAGTGQDECPISRASQLTASYQTPSQLTANSEITGGLPQLS